MKKKCTFIFLILCIASSESFAQINKIFCIKEAQSKESLPAVAFQIVSSSNKILLKGRTLNNGYFILPAAYDSLSGLQLKIMDSIYSPNNFNLTWKTDTIFLYTNVDKTKTLTTVTVKAKVPILKQSAKGAELDITKAPEAKFWNLAEALQQIPGIAVNEQSGTISYMGRALTIVRDGTKVAGFDNLIRSTVSSGRATDYDKIVLNLYDLKTEGATISFVAPKYLNGVFGNTSLTIGNRNIMAIGGITISHNKHLISINPGVGIPLQPSSTSMRSTIYNAIPLRIEESTSNSALKSINPSISISDAISFSALHTLNLSFSYKPNSSGYQVHSLRNEYWNDTLFNSSSLDFESKTVFKNYYDLTGNISYTYKPKPTPKTTKRFDISFEWERDHRGSDFSSEAEVLEGYLLPQTNYINNNLDFANSYFSLIGYELTHKSAGTFEALLKYFNRNLDKQADFYFYKNQPGANDSAVLQNYNVGYQYVAFLSSWDKSFKKFSLRAVLKADYSTDDAANNGQKASFHFFSVSPYLSFFKTIKKSSIRLEANYSQRRPGINNLTSIINYGSQYGPAGVQFRGNPNLKPQNSLDLSALLTTRIKKISVNITSRYVHTSKDISQYRLVEDSVIVATYRNLGGSDKLNMSLSASFNLFPKFTVRVNSSANLGRYKLPVTDSVSKTFSWNEGLGVNYTLTPKLRLSAGVDYGGGSSFQSKIEKTFSTNLSATYSKGKLSFNAGVFNYHHPVREFENIFEGPGFYQISYTRRNQLRAQVGMNYRFGKINKRAVRGKDIIKDDF